MKPGPKLAAADPEQTGSKDGRRETNVSDLQREIERRRTFAIISHPDAGKTTLTEKLLLYGGAIQLAGSVKGKATARHAVSDGDREEARHLHHLLGDAV